MNKSEKTEQLDFLKATFGKIETMVLTSVQGLTVAEVSDLRRQLHDAGISYKVVKNTLAKKAVEGTPLSVIAADFKEVTAIAWSDTDPVGPAKVVANFKKANEKFVVRSGYNAGMRLDADGVKALADLPSIEELRASLLGTMNAVMAKLLAQVNAPAQHVVGVIQAKHDEDAKQAA